MDGAQMPDTPEMTEIDPGQDPRAFRNALGAYATGVTVITTGTATGPVGITANSFASVSLDPPLVLWMPAKTSTRYDVFKDARHYSIHVLDGHQQAVCNGFTQKKDAFDDLDWHTDDTGVPVIGGCLARFDCVQDAVHDAGDHIIILGRVLRAASRPGLPLLFHSGRFVTVKG